MMPENPIEPSIGPALGAPTRIRAPRTSQGRALHPLGDLDLEIAPTVKTAAKWTLAVLLVSIGLGLLATGGIIYMALHFLAKWW